MAKAKTKKKKPAREKLPRFSSLELTQEVIDKLAATVARGNFRYVARGRAGIPEGTFKSWLATGRKELREIESGKRKEETLRSKLVMALDKAESDVHSRIVEDVLESDNLKLKMDYLYRRYGKLYSKNPNSHDDDTGETVKIDALELLAEKLSTFIEE
jgi:hypothetical protein